MPPNNSTMKPKDRKKSKTCGYPVYTAVTSASRSSSGEEVLRLLEAGESPDLSPVGCPPPLYRAVRFNKPQVALALIGAGCRVALPRKMRLHPPVICLAAHLNMTEVVLALCRDPHCDVFATDDERRTFLHWAALRGNLDLVGRLPARCVSRKLLLRREGGCMTAMHLAAGRGDLAMLTLLLDAYLLCGEESALCHPSPLLCGESALASGAPQSLCDSSLSTLAAGAPQSLSDSSLSTLAAGAPQSLSDSSLSTLAAGAPQSLSDSSLSTLCHPSPLLCGESALAAGAPQSLCDSSLSTLAAGAPQSLSDSSLSTLAAGAPQSLCHSSLSTLCHPSPLLCGEESALASGAPQSLCDSSLSTLCHPSPLLCGEESTLAAGAPQSLSDSSLSTMCDPSPLRCEKSSAEASGAPQSLSDSSLSTLCDPSPLLCGEESALAAGAPQSLCDSSLSTLCHPSPLLCGESSSLSAGAPQSLSDSSLSTMCDPSPLRCEKSSAEASGDPQSLCVSSQSTLCHPSPLECQRSSAESSVNPHSLCASSQSTLCDPSTSESTVTVCNPPPPQSFLRCLQPQCDSSNFPCPHLYELYNSLNLESSWNSSPEPLCNASDSSSEPLCNASDSSSEPLCNASDASSEPLCNASDASSEPLCNASDACNTSEPLYDSSESTCSSSHSLPLYDSSQSASSSAQSPRKSAQSPGTCSDPRGGVCNFAPSPCDCSNPCRQNSSQSSSDSGRFSPELTTDSLNNFISSPTSSSSSSSPLQEKNSKLCPEKTDHTHTPISASSSSPEGKNLRLSSEKTDFLHTHITPSSSLEGKNLRLSSKKTDFLHTPTPTSSCSQGKTSRLTTDSLLHLISSSSEGGATRREVPLCPSGRATLKEVVCLPLLGTKDTMLHLAARGHHLEVVTFLLAAGADARAQNIMSVTPLHEVCLTGRADHRAVSIARLLLQSGADCNVKASVPYILIRRDWRHELQGSTPKYKWLTVGMVAALRNRVAYLRILGEFGGAAQFSATSAGGLTVLSQALSQGREEAAIFLLTHHPEPPALHTRTDLGGLPALVHVCSCAGKAGKLAELMLDQGYAVEVTRVKYSHDGWLEGVPAVPVGAQTSSALMRAIGWGQMSVLKAIVECHPHLLLAPPSSLPLSPLHLALAGLSDHLCPPFVDFLLAHGANPDHEVEGRTAYEHAGPPSQSNPAYLREKLGEAFTSPPPCRAGEGPERCQHMGAWGDEGGGGGVPLCGCVRGRRGEGERREAPSLRHACMAAVRTCVRQAGRDFYGGVTALPLPTSFIQRLLFR